MKREMMTHALLVSIQEAIATSKELGDLPCVTQTLHGGAFWEPYVNALVLRLSAWIRAGHPQDVHFSHEVPATWWDYVLAALHADDCPRWLGRLTWWWARDHPPMYHVYHETRQVDTHMCPHLVWTSPRGHLLFLSGNAAAGKGETDMSGEGESKL